jgi:hypothetical protein
MKWEHRFLVLSLLITDLCSGGISAEWIKDTNQNMPVCTAKDEQHFPDLISDGHGGIIVAWQDVRNKNRDVFAQRVSEDGEMLWGNDGVPVCNLTSPQVVPIVVTDAQGGASIVFGDSRHGNQDIYAQRIDAKGKLLWDKDSIPVCVETSQQGDVKAISDGRGGMIVVWEDWRNENQDIYAQRISSDGKPAWKVNGVPVYRGDGDQYDPFLTTDENGGAIIVWWDISTPDWNIFVQRINAAGEPVWGTEGVPVCTALGNQGGPFIVADGSGGAFVVWSDYRNDPNIYTNADLYAQRINSDGQPLWKNDGISICNDPSNQQQPEGISDGMGGVIVVWWDDRDIFSDIYAQRIRPDGTLAWEINGIPICVAGGVQREPRLVSDGSRGAVVYWMDYRDDYGDVTVDAIYAQRINASGKSLWAFNGIPVCMADGAQRTPRAISNGNGGAFVVWGDQRNEDPDIYLHQIP